MQEILCKSIRKFIKSASICRIENNSYIGIIHYTMGNVL